MKELRIGLVCYGGGSLAIYMHGITRELHKLVRASAYLQRVPEADGPGALEDSERVYWRALRHFGGSGGLRVVIDIIAGTSAGGINAVVLAKALAHDLDQDPLRDAWLEEADIRRISHGPRWLPFWLKAPVLAALAPFRSRARRPPLDGDHMLDLIRDVLDEMDASGPERAGGGSLVPEGQQLQLFVTVTDFEGMRRVLPVYDPRRGARPAGRSLQEASDRQHAQLLRFAHVPGSETPSDFSNNPALAFAARATSSFPGAFPPVSIEDVRRSERRKGRRWDGEPSFVSRFLRGYELARQDPRRAHFVDGGVLNNKPFEPVVRAIAERGASCQVVRRLLYIEPDPVAIEQTEDGERPGWIRSCAGQRPGWLETLKSAVIGIRSHEPIFQDMLALDELNDRIERFGRLVEASRQQVEEMLEAELGARGGLSAAVDGLQLDRCRSHLNEVAEERAGIGYPAYARLKLASVVDELADALNRLFAYPRDSEHAGFVRRVVRAWAREHRIIPGGGGLSEDQKAFLRSFDIGYRRRRIRFVVSRLDEWYEGARGVAAASPPREQIDEIKGAFYRLESRLGRLMAGGSLARDLRVCLAEVLGEGPVSAALEWRPGSAKAYMRAHLDILDSAVGELAERVKAGMPAIHEEVGTLFDRMRSLGWPDGVRRDLLARHLGFAFWDLLVYPVCSLADVAELRPVRAVRMSPNEATVLEPGGAAAALKGVSLGHFGAFFTRRARENDYLWGRLDAAERIIDLLADAGRDRAAPPRPDPETGRSFVLEALHAILDVEREALRGSRALVRDLRHRVVEMGG